MLTVVVPEQEGFDEQKDMFCLLTKETTLQLEHSLISVSKWEAKHHKPFLAKEDKTNEEILDYIRDMTISKNVDDAVYRNLPASVLAEINDYIADPMTATTVLDTGGRRNNDIITSEIIYYWMISFGIPFECQKWHLARLLTLIRVCSEKSQPGKKMSRAEVLARNQQLNAERRKLLGSKG